MLHMCRYKCTVCEDRDLCSSCMQGLLSAKAVLAGGSNCSGGAHRHSRSCSSSDASTGTALPQEVDGISNAVARISLAADAVPCLDPQHEFTEMQGPERMAHLALPPRNVMAFQGVTEHAAVTADVHSYLRRYRPSQHSEATLAWISVGYTRHTQSDAALSEVAKQAQNTAFDLHAPCEVRALAQATIDLRQCVLWPGHALLH